MTVPPLPRVLIEPTVRAALLEDLGRAGDVTTDATIPAGTQAEAAIVSRAEGVAAGLAVARLAFDLVDPALTIAQPVEDGARIARGTVLMTVRGEARSILTAERVALNFAGRLSGIASLTRRFADAITRYGDAA